MPVSIAARHPLELVALLLVELDPPIDSSACLDGAGAVPELNRLGDAVHQLIWFEAADHAAQPLDVAGRCHASSSNASCGSTSRGNPNSSTARSASRCWAALRWVDDAPPCSLQRPCR
jgi:hypothetical protein